MNTVRVILLIGICSIATIAFYGCQPKSNSENSFSNLLYKDGYSESLCSIMQKTNIQADGTLTDLLEKVQKSQAEGGWLRPQGVERWELPHSDNADTNWYTEQFRNMGFIDEIKPANRSYRYAVLLGSTIQGMRSRFAYLLYLILHEHIAVNDIIFLVGQRPRDEKKENIDVLFNEQHPELPFNTDWKPSGEIPSTETDLARLIIEQSDMPNHIRQRIVIVDTPMVTKPDGTKVRPITDDTVHAWLNTNPEIGSVLCISSQPYVGRQLHVMQRLLPKGWNIECVGPVANILDITPSLVLDTLARSLFELSRLQKVKE